MFKPTDWGVKMIMLLLSTLLLSILPLVASRAVSPLPAIAELLPLPGISLDVNLHLSQNSTVAYHRLGKRALSQTSITKGRRLDCLMSATIAHAQQINGGVRVEENFDEYFSLLFDEGWEQQTIDPKYASSGIQANLQTLTGANPDNTDYLYFLSKESGEIDGQSISVSLPQLALEYGNQTDIFHSQPEHSLVTASMHKEESSLRTITRHQDTHLAKCHFFRFLGLYSGPKQPLEHGNTRPALGMSRFRASAMSSDRGSRIRKLRTRLSRL